MNKLLNISPQIFRLRKAFISLLLMIFTIFFFESCKKETIEPDPGGGNNGGNGNGSSNITQVDVNGLKQNHVNAEGVSKIKLTDTSIESYESNNETYSKISFYGESNTLISIITKGAKLKEGNYSLKKFRLGSNPTENEAVVTVAISSTTLDFEFTDNDRFSIAQNAEGFYILKMGPSVGIKRNSWDPELTVPISFHIVTNHQKVKISDSINGNLQSVLYSYKVGNHSKSNQPFASIYFSKNAPGKSVAINFIDYDLSVNNISKNSYTLSQTAPSISDQYNGTVPKGVYISYDFGKFTQDYSLIQNIEMELNEQYIILKYTDIKMVKKTDPNESVTLSGEITIAR